MDSDPDTANAPGQNVVTTEDGIVTTAVPILSTTILTPVSATGIMAAAMPAPKTQAPPRSRRMPAIDPSNLIPTRRSSTRFIKRKKFDDELVESSLVKTERGRIKTAATTPTTPTPAAQTRHSVQAHGSTNVVASLPTAVADTAISTSVTLTVGTNSSGISLVPAPTLIPTAPSASTVSPHIQPTVIKPLREATKETVKQVDAATATVTRPPPEKRSKPSTGKTQLTSKAVGGKVPALKSVAGKSGVTKTSGSKSSVARSGHSKSRSKSKRSRKQKTATPAVKDLGRWKPQDDLALITAVQQTNDLSAVHTGVKFSCRFSLKEIEQRWYALLYDPAISKIAMEAARQLHSETVATIQGKALYSNAEEKLLGTYTSTSQPTVESFHTLLQQNPDVFHPARTAKTLQSHWLLMKQYHLLPDQTVQPMPRGDHILNLSDIEDFMNDDSITEGKDEIIEQELALVDRRNKREIRHLEQEMPKWQVLVDSVTGISMPDFDSQTLAVLRGRLVRYLMRSREISLGRATKDNHVDVDLSLEGPAWKVSRRQGIIKLRNSGDFFIANEGKRPILVDGRPVMAGNKQKLNNNSVVEISCLRFTFLINQDVINAIRTDASKIGTAVAATS